MNWNGLRICSRCGSSNQIEKHHIVYRVNGGSNDPDNIKDLCRACHDYQHSLENIQSHIQRSIKRKQTARLKIWQYRLQVLETLNTPELIRVNGFTSYWTDIKTHYMSREVKVFESPIVEVSQSVMRLE